MNITVSCGKFKAALANIKMVSSSSKSGIYSNVEIQTDPANNRIQLTGANQEMVITDSIEAVVDGEEASFLLPWGKLSDITSSFSEGEFVFNLDLSGQDETKRSVKLQTPDAVYQLKWDSAKDFIVSAASEENDDIKASFNLSASQLNNILRQTIDFCAPKGEWRSYLIGVFFELEKGKGDKTDLVCVATDTHKMAYTSTQVETDGKIKTIVPKDTVITIRSLLATHSAEATVNLKFSDEKAWISLGDIQLSTSLINATFPDYKRVLPSEEYRSFQTMDRKAMQQKLKLASPISPSIVLDLSADSQSVRASNDVGESFNSPLDASTFEGEELEISFASNLLATALNVIDQPEIRIDYYGNLQGARITPNSDEVSENAKSIFIVMPMRM